MATFDLVFEGGGAKGVAFAGALEVLWAHGHRTGRLVGTSAGAIAAVLCAAGYSPGEMQAALAEKRNGRPRFLSFFDTPLPEDFSVEVRTRSLLGRALRKIDLPWIPAALEDDFDRLLLSALLRQPKFARLFSLVESGGLFRGEALADWVAEKLEGKAIPASATFRDFHRSTGADLTVVAADPEDREMLVLNHRTAPDLPVAVAVRMSVSIPFVWQPVRWRPEWGLYLDRPKAGHGIVDGGLLSNFPLRLLVEDTLFVRTVMGDRRPDPSRSLGLLLDEELSVPGAPSAPEREPVWEEIPLFRLALEMAAMVMAVWDNPAMKRFDHLICRLPAKGYGTLEFEMDDVRRERLLAASRAAMMAHLDRRSREPGLAA